MAESTSRTLVVLGAAGTGLFIAESARAAGWTVPGFLDDTASNEVTSDFSILGRLRDWRVLPESCLFVSSLYGAKKTGLFQDLVESLQIPDDRWASVIHQTAMVFPSTRIGPGCFIGPGCVLESRVALGSRCALLGAVYLGHDTKLNDYVACANSVSTAGYVTIGSGSFIGANATIRQNTQIGSRAIVGMASAVLTDVGDRTTVVGNPARVLR